MFLGHDTVVVLCRAFSCSITAGESTIILNQEIYLLDASPDCEGS